MSDRHDNELDAIIEKALAGYSQTEPLAGLEQRVLQRVRIGEKRRPRWYMIPAAAAIAAAMLVAIVIGTRPAAAPVKQASVPLRDGSVASPKIETTRPERRPSMPASARRPARQMVHQQRRFPSTTPLSREERALLALVQRDPAKAESAFTDVPPGKTAPLEIDSIVVTPLIVDDDQ